ncbi:MAG TPA: HDOD domain-containing protein [Deltaproteobacteria bacterium]|nr:HDOD domain-containing protein [Deltaproteobacteria bacterium]
MRPRGAVPAMSNRLDSYLKASEGDLPTMPAIAGKVVQAVDNPDSSIDDIRSLIEQDAAIAARILKISNSALYGFPSEIQSLSHAISLLGTMTVRNLVLAASMKETYKRFGLMEKLLWQHSSLAGPVAAMLAGYRGIALDPDIAFTAGLMHHIGKTALANSHRDQYEQVMATVYNEGRSFTDVENEVFGFSHAELGAAVVQQWGLPDSLVLTIQYHHSPERLTQLDEEDARLCALTTVTSLCLSKLGVGRSRPIDDLDLNEQPAWAFLDLGPHDVEPILNACAERVKESQAIVG